MPAGRPPVMTEAVVKQLEQAFSMGCTDLEACQFAGISKQTLYNYQDKNPKFIDRKAQLKENPALLARNNIYAKLQEGDADTSKWYLERKKKDEFSTRSEQKHEGEINLVSMDKDDESL